MSSPPEVAPLLAPGDIDSLRSAFAEFTAEGVDAAVGLAGRSAFQRGDLAAIARLTTAQERVNSQIRLFLLGAALDEAQARRALEPLTLDRAAAAGLIARSAGAVRALVDIRPYAEAEPPLAAAAVSRAQPWWVVSDIGSDVRPGPVAADHVLGIGAASLTLAQASLRSTVSTALDIGTGCGIQALHLSQHAASVTATDVSPRALRFAATTAALSGLHWRLRSGSLLEPVQQESFDLVVANPPFVISAGRQADGIGFDYRDSGFAGDGVIRELVASLPGVLSQTGCAQLLANWMITADAGWDERIGGWLTEAGCDAWVWQREMAEPGEYVAMWMRDAGQIPGTDGYTDRYDQWTSWLEGQGVIAIGMGMINLWRARRSTPDVVLEDVPQSLEQPIGMHIGAWHARRRWLADADDNILLTTTLLCAPDVVRSRDDLRSETGWRTAQTRLRQSHGMRWEVLIDDAMSAFVAGCNGQHTVADLLQVLALTLGVAPDRIADASLPIIRDLVSRAFLLIAELVP